MADLYPPFVLGDYVETWDYTNHGRGDGPSSFGIIVNLNPMRIQSKDGKVFGDGDEVRVRTPAPRPTFVLADHLDEFEEVVKRWADAHETRRLVQEACDKADHDLDALRANFRANTTVLCPHPANLTIRNVCQVCGADFNDDWY